MTSTSTSTPSTTTITTMTMTLLWSHLGLYGHHSFKFLTLASVSPNHNHVQKAHRYPRLSSSTDIADRTPLQVISGQSESQRIHTDYHSTSTATTKTTATSTTTTSDDNDHRTTANQDHDSNRSSTLTATLTISRHQDGIVSPLRHTSTTHSGNHSCSTTT